jgi:beta-phosphoglucomutase family hydrolase
MAVRLEAVIWDMDGVIADTGRYHFQAWQDVFVKRGIKFTLEDFKNHFGQRNDTIIRYAFKGTISPEEVDVVAREKEASYRGRVAANVKALPGAIELIKSLRQYSIKTAIASSAPPENINLIISKLAIEKYFDAIVWGREVTEGKPSPQAFLLAAQRLGATPENCVVIEDAVAGVAAAKRAGMKCVAVTNTNLKAKLKEADIVVDSLKEMTVDSLARLFQTQT